jgi:hypothetical protein
MDVKKNLQMQARDKNYLTLQFRNRIYSLEGNSFQTFFENIMEKTFPDFQKIRPNGRDGDGGNDGYRKLAGVYYQVYAPNKPSIMDKNAVDKMVRDFKKVLEKWEKTATIKEYIFVFNDKYGGSTQRIEEAITDLEKNFNEITFTVLLAKDLEEIFFKLDETALLDLKFDIDLRKSITVARQYLQSIEDELDKSNGVYALKILGITKDIIFSLQDDNLVLECYILEFKCLRSTEQIEKAIELLEGIVLSYPKDSRALLYLAEIYLSQNDFVKNEELLKRAGKIDVNFWLYKLETLVRILNLGVNIDLNEINEKLLPQESRQKAAFYRIYSRFFQNSNDLTNAYSFIEKAISFNKERIQNYLSKLSIIESELFLNQASNLHPNTVLEKLSVQIDRVEEMFCKGTNIGPRHTAQLNLSKLKVLLAKGENTKVIELSMETLNLLLNCNFDTHIDSMLSIILMHIYFSDQDLRRLQSYLQHTSCKLSSSLLKAMLIQFTWKNLLSTNGNDFFKAKGEPFYLDLINDMYSDDFSIILNFLSKDTTYAIRLINVLQAFPKLKEFLIVNLAGLDNDQKNKLLLLLNYEQNNYDAALRTLKKIDISRLDYESCKIVLHIAEEKGAWDFKQIVLKKLIEKENDDHDIEKLFKLKLELLNCAIHLKQHLEILAQGYNILNHVNFFKFLSEKNKEQLIGQIINTHMERGEYSKATEILEIYPIENASFEFKIAIETQLYIKNGNAKAAIDAITKGSLTKGKLSPEEYAKLYYYYVQIGNLIAIDLNSDVVVSDGSYVKLKDQIEWFFLGEGNPLDASQIYPNDKKYTELIGMQLKSTVTFKDRYRATSSEYLIEQILPISKYILCQCYYHFRKLTEEKRWNAVQIVDIPDLNGEIDTQYLQRMLEDIEAQKKPFFDFYCNSNVPLAVLAISEGGIINAIGHIQNENRGFIHFSDGSIKDEELQKSLSRDVLKNNIPFYIDGTSAIMLAESGFLEKIFDFIPNVRIPQSVINLLIVLKNKFEYSPGYVGTMGYSNGKIFFSTNDHEMRKERFQRIEKSITLLESLNQNIRLISSASKEQCLSEQKIPAELCDACILSQKDNIPLLTEDFLYLVMNNLQTNKCIPPHFSTLFLVKVLFEQKKISFLEYIEYFGYLSMYRFRFLSLNSDDILQSVLGEGKIFVIRPENIRMLNLSFTLSEEYGVPFHVAFDVVTDVIRKMLLDATIPIEVIEKTFIELVNVFPGKLDKKMLGLKIIDVCRETIKSDSSHILDTMKKMTLEDYFKKLENATDIWNLTNVLWLPNH